jgi:hypothetical protein
MIGSVVMSEISLGVTFITHIGTEHRVYLFDGFNDKWYILNNMGIWHEVDPPDCDLIPY